MLKKIQVDQLRLGMHLRSFEGSWGDHPFWRASFVLLDPADLARARASGIGECWIDTGLGVDVAASSVAAAAPVAEVDVSVAAGASVVAESASTRRVSLDAELHRAAKLCKTASTQVMAMFEDVRLGRTLDAERCLPLVHDISASVIRNPGAMLSLARLKTQDDYTYMHSVAVCALMVALGRQMGLDEAACRDAGMAGLMHDIGKAAISPRILGKPGKLDDEETAIIKTHPVRGYELLTEGSAASETTLDVCLHHHERMDGAGYPHRLARDDISMFARMGAVCDVYDAVTSDRPYKAGWDPSESIVRMAQWEGHFDPAMLKALIHTLGIYPIGSLVELESRRIAVVVEQNTHALTKPVVKIFFSQRSKMPVVPEIVDLAAPGCQDSICARTSMEGRNERQIASLWAGVALPKGYKAPRRRADQPATSR